MKPLLFFALAGYGVSIPMVPSPTSISTEALSTATPIASISGNTADVICSLRSAVPICALPSPEGIVLEPFNTAKPQTHTFFLPGDNHFHGDPITWPRPIFASATPPVATPRDTVRSPPPKYRRTPAFVTPHSPHSTSSDESSVSDNKLPTRLHPLEETIATPSAPASTLSRKPKTRKPGHHLPTRPLLAEDTVATPSAPAIVTPHAPTTTVVSTEDDGWPLVSKPYPSALKPWPASRPYPWHFIDPSLIHEGNQSVEATSSAMSMSTAQRRTSHLDQESQPDDTESSNDQMSRGAERVDLSPDAREEDFDQDLDWFETIHWFSRLAQEEETPPGYDQVVSNYNASAARQSISSFALPDYDAQVCSGHCDRNKRCQSFGHYVERQPSCTDCEEGTTVEAVNMCELYNARLSPRMITHGNSDWRLPGMKFTRAVRAFNGYNRVFEAVETVTVTVLPTRSIARVTITHTAPAFPAPSTITIVTTTTETSIISMAAAPVTVEDTSTITLPPETSTVHLASPVFITVTQAPSTSTQTQTQTQIETSTESYTVISTTTESSTSTETQTLTETATESFTSTATTTESATVTQTSTTRLLATLTATTTIPVTVENGFTWLAEASGPALRPGFDSETGSDTD